MNGKIRFGIAADSHYADRDSFKTRNYRESLDRLQEFVDEMNTQQVDFIIHLGDLKDEAPDKDEEKTLTFLNDIECVFMKFNGPTYHCIGNHDVDSITKKQFLDCITNTGIANDRNYYSFDLNGFHFVVLDANYNSDGTDQYFKAGGNWQDMHIPDQQLNWLKADLIDSPLPTIVFCHHPLFDFFRKGYKYHINNYSEVQKILEDQGQVFLVIQGHVHEEKIVYKNGINYITFPAMVDYSGPDQNAFSLVEIENGEISIKGYHRATSFTPDKFQ